MDIMEEEIEKKKSNRGGHREGAGRKSKGAKGTSLRIRVDLLERISRLPIGRTEFIEQAIEEKLDRDEVKLNAQGIADFVNSQTEFNEKELELLIKNNRFLSELHKPNGICRAGSCRVIINEDGVAVVVPI